MSGRLSEHGGAFSDHLQRPEQHRGQRVDQHRERGEFLLGAERRLGRRIHALQRQLSELPRLESAHRERHAHLGGTAGGDQPHQLAVERQYRQTVIVYLTDGLPTEDNQAESLITALPNEATVGGACDNTTKSPYNGLDANGVAIPGGWDFPGPSGKAGKCMAALAKYMFTTDMSSSMAGQQNVQLYTIGFGNDPGLAVASSWLATAATAVGGQFYQTGDPNRLQTSLTNIVRNALK